MGQLWLTAGPAWGVAGGRWQEGGLRSSGVHRRGPVLSDSIFSPGGMGAVGSGLSPHPPGLSFPVHGIPVQAGPPRAFCSAAA